VEAFIARWQGSSGQERANYAMFLSELCDLIGVPKPSPAKESAQHNDYVFERAVFEPGRDSAGAWKRIDLYRRDAFVLEAKQSRRRDGNKRDKDEQPELFEDGESLSRGRRSVNRSWDHLMMNARKQAEGYVRLLPQGHTPPPFVVVCDVGHCFELYANFRRDGKAYDQFPDRQRYRIYLEDLRRQEVQEHLKMIWTDPLSLDPARETAKVTREIAERLAKVSRALEKKEFNQDALAMFVIRLLFTMFAEDVDLLPHDSFTNLLRECEESPDSFPPLMEELWRNMDEGKYSSAVRAHLPMFNGLFFKDRRAFKLGREEIGELRRAAERDWRMVEPAIFGTFLEQALDKDDRRRLGAHYTPRAYVERLVIATVIEPLREDWAKALSTAERQKGEGRLKPAIQTIRGFHDQLCKTRVLDPACGTGNFLYVALELMKKLEAEVLDALVALGGQEALRGLESHSVSVNQFLGVEINPRAAAIAELVLWIGDLQWHFRTHQMKPDPPILKDYKNITKMDAVLTWEGYPEWRFIEGRETLPNSRRPEWPEAEFIVGNPPFIGGKDIRARLGDAYAEALWDAHSHMNESADFVMYWWDRAAELLTRKDTSVRRFGLVTTNSISQVFQRRVMERHLEAKKPVEIVMAMPDHPWTKATKDAAAVRIAMTVAEAKRAEANASGQAILREVVSEEGVDTDSPVIGFQDRKGTINSDLTVGVDVTTAKALLANEGVCSPGVKLHGAGFIVTPAEAVHLGLGRRLGLETHIRHYRNGRDLTARPRNVMVIDLFGLEAEEARQRFPEVYQHLLRTIKPERDRNNRDSYRVNWWIFGEPRRELRPALKNIGRYIATVETAKHRIFQFLDGDVLPDNMLVAIAIDTGFELGLLSSRFHGVWALKAGGWLGVGNDPRYSKSRCFDPFPFPETTDAQKEKIGAVAEELDTHRKRVLTKHENITLTGLYNILERLRDGVAPDALSDAERRTFDDGFVLILKELHDELDKAVAEAYGWPRDLAEEEVLARLVALNRERAEEERRGLVRWLRPDYQIPRFGSARERAAQIEADLLISETPLAAVNKASFPKTDSEQTAAVFERLRAAAHPLTSEQLASEFKQGRKIEKHASAVIAALARQGHVSSPDNGRSWVM
jgi:hypothetical protein